jgi:hypothetical protein
VVGSSAELLYMGLRMIPAGSLRHICHRVRAALHEDVERMERVIVKDLKRDMKTHKEKVLQSHRVKRRLDTIQAAASKLVGCRSGFLGL